jgi:predicted 2-oxoglutarate/Fe(II)-dependent dioxygenase YbiX
MIENFKVIENFWSADHIAHIRQRLEYDKLDNFNDNAAANVSKTCIVEAVPWSKCNTYLQDLEQLAHYTNHAIFGFNIKPFGNYDTVNINTYSSNLMGEYGWHNDFILTERIYDNKITVVVNISEFDYQGGKFELFLNEPGSIDDKPGTVIIFPSWTQHRVSPVTSGERKSLSFWIMGPKFC